MTNDQIKTFFSNANLKTRIVRIDFKTRDSIVGLFVETKDSAELNAKNFWRVISESKIEEFLSAKDPNLTRIFNGSEFTKLSIIKSKN
jgi:fructose-1-phosphate kinase PfkB-like protein